MATLVKHTETGAEVVVPDHYLDHPVWGPFLTPINEDGTPVVAPVKSTKSSAASVDAPVIEG